VKGSQDSWPHSAVAMMMMNTMQWRMMVAMATHDLCYYSKGTVFLMSTRIQEQESGEIGLREP